MRRLRKGPEPEALARSRREVVRQEREGRPVADPWALTVDKSEVAEALCRDQGDLCAYCGGRIRPGAMKVEHFEPRAKAPERTHDWRNLLGVCEGERVFPDGRRVKHCDSHRASWSPGPPSRGLLNIHPVESALDPAELLPVVLTGPGAGRMNALGPEAEADRTELNLNADHLVQNRKEVIDQLRRRMHPLDGPSARREMARMLKAATGLGRDLPVYAFVEVAWLEKHLMPHGGPAHPR